jgi:TatA/E family protein of Tat protein translocase
VVLGPRASRTRDTTHRLDNRACSGRDGVNVGHARARSCAPPPTTYITKDSIMHEAHTLALIGNIGMPELIIIAIVALLIFGKRLPEVGKSLGRGIVEFKRGLADTGVGREVESVRGAMEDAMSGGDDESRGALAHVVTGGAVASRRELASIPTTARAHAPAARFSVEQAVAMDLPAAHAVADPAADTSLDAPGTATPARA